MGVTFNSLSDKAYKKFVDAGMTQEGSASMLGNIFAESGMIANRVEILCLKRIKEYYGITYTDETYTEAVNSGKISRAQFLNPLPGKQYGYSCTQLTSPIRKAGLYDRTVAIGKSIADEDIQLEYVIYELKTSYQSVWKTLTSSHSIKECSDKVLKDFESPANWSQYSSQRVSYSQEYYNHYKTTTTTKGSDNVATTTDKPIKAVMGWAKSEDGYIEKNNANNLDSKTAGAGSGNYTKYWRDLGLSGWQGQPYCAAFIAWLFMKAFGKDTAQKLLKHWPFTYCPTLASMTSNKTPKVGSIILFYRNGEYVHTGYVIGVTDSTITTVEGNTSGGSTIVANGGQVVYGKTYNRSSLSPATKYFMPDYSIVKTINTVDGGSTASTSTTAKEKPWKAKFTKDTKVRTWAGTEYKEVSYSPMKKGTEVEIQYSLKANDGSTWYYFKWGTDKSAFTPSDSVKKVEATTTTTTTTTTTKQRKYRVQCGVFDKKANAKVLQKDLKKAGVDTIIVKVGKQYIVQAGMFDKIENAAAYRDEIQPKVSEVVIIAVNV